MARPAILCKLQKGALIDANPGFVDTFNFLVDFIENLRGEGAARVDRSVHDHPVIRVGSGSSSGSGLTGSVVGDPELKWNQDGSYKLELWGKIMTFSDGQLVSIGELEKISEIDTVGYEVS